MAGTSAGAKKGWAGRKRGSSKKTWAEMTHAEKVRASAKSKAAAKAEIEKVRKKGYAGNQNRSNYPVRISGVGKSFSGTK